MLLDPVFRALQEYKDEHKGDVIRYEMAIRAEISRIRQYQKVTFTKENQEQLNNVEKIFVDNLSAVLALIPPYLNFSFNQELKKTNFWDRRSLKANCLNWKYTFYAKERHTATEELVALLSDKVTITVKQVKESAK